MIHETRGYCGCFCGWRLREAKTRRNHTRNLFNDTHASILVCLLTTDIQDAPLFRLDIDPSDDNGLKKRSQIMVDKIVALRRERISSTIGKIDDDTLISVNRSLALFLGLAQ